MKRSLFFIVFLIVLLVAQLAVFVPCVYAQSTVGTSTYAFPVSYPHQRKGFYANTRFWVFYSDGANMVYKTSLDGTSWGSSTTVRACTNGYMFSVWFDGTYFHYAYAAFGTSIYYRKGLPNSDGTTTWSADEQTVSTTYNKAWYPFVSTDSDGYVWVGYADVTGTSCYPYIIKSQYNNGSWGTTPASFPYKLSTTASGSYGNPNWRISIIPLTVLKMVAIYAYNGITAKVQSWNGTAWDIEAATASTTYNIYHSAVAQEDYVHLTFLTSDVAAKVWIVYVKYTYSTNSFGAETTLVEVSSSNPSAPVISIDDSNNLYVFRAGPTTKHIYYHKWNGTGWETAVDWITEATALTANDRLSCFYKQYGSYIGLTYSTGTANPYSVRFAYLTFAAAALSFFGSTSLSFSVATSKTVSFNRQGAATLTFATVGTYSKTGILNLLGSAILSFTSGMSEALSFNRYGTSTLTFVSNMQKTMQFNRYGEAVLTFTSIGEYLSGVFLNLFGSALLTFTTEALKTFEFCRYGSTTLTFATLAEKAMSFARYGASSLTFVAESLRSISRTFTFDGSATLSFLSEQLRTFTFNRYGTALLSFTVESVTQGLGKVLAFFGSAVLNFTVFGEAAGLTVIDLIGLALSFLALAFSIYPLLTSEEKALPALALVMAIVGCALSVLALWYALPVAALSFVLSMAALATKKD